MSERAESCSCLQKLLPGYPTRLFSEGLPALVLPNHPWFDRLVALDLQGGKWHVVRTMIPGAVLPDVLLSETTLFPIITWAIRAVWVLHERTGYHGNLKPSNLIISGDIRELAQFSVIFCDAYHAPDRWRQQTITHQNQEISAVTLKQLDDWRRLATIVQELIRRVDHQQGLPAPWREQLFNLVSVMNSEAQPSWIGRTLWDTLSQTFPESILNACEQQRMRADLEGFIWSELPEHKAWLDLRFERQRNGRGGCSYLRVLEEPTEMELAWVKLRAQTQGLTLETMGLSQLSKGFAGSQPSASPSEGEESESLTPDEVLRYEQVKRCVIQGEASNISCLLLHGSFDLRSEVISGLERATFLPHCGRTLALILDSGPGYAFRTTDDSELEPVIDREYRLLERFILTIFPHLNTASLLIEIIWRQIGGVNQSIAEFLSYLWELDKFKVARGKVIGFEVGAALNYKGRTEQQQGILEDLDDESLQVLHLAAAIGQTFSRNFICKLAGVIESETGLAILSNKNLIKPDLKPGNDGFRFTSGRLWRKVYWSIPEPRRKLLHARIVEKLTAPGINRAPLVLAFHAYKADNSEVAFTSMVTVAKERLRHGEWLEAELYLGELVTAPGTSSPRTALFLALAQARLMSGKFLAARAALTAALAACPDPTQSLTVKVHLLLALALLDETTDYKQLLKELKPKLLDSTPLPGNGLDNLWDNFWFMDSTKGLGFLAQAVYEFRHGALKRCSLALKLAERLIAATELTWFFYVETLSLAVKTYCRRQNLLAAQKALTTLQGVAQTNWNLWVSTILALAQVQVALAFGKPATAKRILELAERTAALARTQRLLTEAAVLRHRIAFVTGCWQTLGAAPGLSGELFPENDDPNPGQEILLTRSLAQLKRGINDAAADRYGVLTEPPARNLAAQWLRLQIVRARCRTISECQLERVIKQQLTVLAMIGDCEALGRVALDSLAHFVKTSDYRTAAKLLALLPVPVADDLNPQALTITALSQILNTPMLGLSDLHKVNDLADSLSGLGYSSDAAELRLLSAWAWVHGFLADAGQEASRIQPVTPALVKLALPRTPELRFAHKALAKARVEFTTSGAVDLQNELTRLLEFYSGLMMPQQEPSRRWESSIKVLARLSAALTRVATRTEYVTLLPRVLCALMSGDVAWLILRDIVSPNGCLLQCCGSEPDYVARLGKDFVQEVAGLAPEQQLLKGSQVGKFIAGYSLARFKWAIYIPIGTPAEMIGGVYIEGSLSESPSSRFEAELFPAISYHLSLGLERFTREELLVDSSEQESLPAPPALGLIGSSRGMVEIVKKIKAVKDTRSNVLILGESGTGKELVARAVHQRGKRASAPFIPCFCGGIPEELWESELFGHVKGSFTGATATRVGLLESAQGGTLFLDEIADVPLPIQTKLLRVIQEREIKPVGSNAYRQIDVRFIAATNGDLDQAIKAGKFREDLFYRLAVVVIRIPPLRERVEDIPDLALYYLKKYNTELGKRIRGFHPDTMTTLCQWRWPGNVRELQNEIEAAVTMATTNDLICPRHLSEKLRERFSIEQLWATGLEQSDQVEKDALLSALEEAGWNKSKAAQIFGISRQGFYRKLLRHGLL